MTYCSIIFAVAQNKTKTTRGDLRKTLKKSNPPNPLRGRGSRFPLITRVLITRLCEEPFGKLRTGSDEEIQRFWKPLDLPLRGMKARVKYHSHAAFNGSR